MRQSKLTFSISPNSASDMVGGAMESLNTPALTISFCINSCPSTPFPVLVISMPLDSPIGVGADGMPGRFRILARFVGSFHTLSGTLALAAASKAAARSCVGGSVESAVSPFSDAILE